MLFWTTFPWKAACLHHLCVKPPQWNQSLARLSCAVCHSYRLRVDDEITTFIQFSIALAEHKHFYFLLPWPRATAWSTVVEGFCFYLLLCKWRQVGRADWQMQNAVTGYTLILCLPSQWPLLNMSLWVKRLRGVKSNWVMPSGVQVCLGTHKRHRRRIHVNKQVFPRSPVSSPS